MDTVSPFSPGPMGRRATAGTVVNLIYRCSEALIFFLFHYLH
jgi:hypothetical protein